VSNKPTTSTSSVLEKAGIFSSATKDKAFGKPLEPSKEETRPEATEQETQVDRQPAIDLAGKKKRGTKYERYTSYLEKDIKESFNDFIKSNNLYANEVLNEAVSDLLKKYHYGK